MYPTIMLRTDIILEKIQGSQAWYRKGSYRRSHCICLLNLLHRLLSVDFVPRNYTNKTVFTDRREGRGWEKGKKDLISWSLTKLNSWAIHRQCLWNSRAFRIIVTNFNFTTWRWRLPRLFFFFWKMSSKCHSLSFRHEDVNENNTYILLSCLHYLVYFPSFFSKLKVIRSLSLIAFLME